MNKSATKAGALPEGWRWVKLGEVCLTSSGGTPSRGNREYYRGSIPWIKSGELKDCTVTSTEETITERGLDSSSANIVPNGTLLIAMYGATVGRLGITGMKSATNQAVCAIFPNGDADKNFLFFYLFYIRKGLIETSFGGAQPNISQSVIRNLQLPLPPLSEQKRIAAILEEQMAAVENARVAAQTRLEAIKALPAAFLRQIFPLPDQPLPEGWRWVKLGEVCKVVGGSTPDTANLSYWNGDIVWVTPTDLGKLFSTVISKSERLLTTTGREKCNAKILPIGAVVMSSRAPIGHLAIAEKPLCTNQGCKSFVPNKNIDSIFLYWALKKAVPAIQSLGSGATFTEVSKFALQAFEIPLPLLAEQKRIATTLREQMAAVGNIRTAAEEELSTINAIPAALLRRAFGGKL